MSNHKARFRGDIQVDGSILGPDGEPIDLGGGDGGSVDLTHLTELAFGDDSLTELRLLTDAEAEGYYATPGTGFHINRTLVVDDPDYNGIMVVNSDAWSVESDYEQAGADMYVGYNGGNFAAWAPDTVHPGNYKRVAIGAGYGFTRISSLPTDQFAQAYVGGDNQPHFRMDIAGKISWGDGSAVPDVSLERDATGVFNNTGVGDLRIPGHHALIVGLDANYSLAGAYYGPDDIYMQSVETAERSEMQPGYLSLSGGSAGINASARDGDATLYLGSMNPSIDLNDAHLKRTAPGTLEIDHTLSFKGDADDSSSGVSVGWNGSDYAVQFVGPVGSGGAQATFRDIEDASVHTLVKPGAVVAFGDGGFVTVNGSTKSLSFFDEGEQTGLHLVSPGALEIHVDEGPSSLILHSLDGTAYKLTPPNGGGPAEWVAA